jgi:DNA polymerase
MTNIEYVMHPDTEIISLSMKVGNNAATMVYFGEAEITKALKTVDWTKSMAIGHNMSGFDALILAWRFKIAPAMWGCTLAMARSKYNANVGGSLGKLVAHFADELHAMGISGVKDNSALLNTKGKKLADFTRDEIKHMAIYNKTDTEQCYGLFRILARETPPAELLQIDLTTRMLTEPQFVVDTDLLSTALRSVQEEKLRSLKELANMMMGPDEQATIVLEGGRLDEYVRTQLMSSAKFSEILNKRNVDVPMKPSPTDPSKQIPALSKTDQAFLDLQEHEDPLVACAARARLEAKSTLLETRINAFLQAAGRLKGFLPMPLRYNGATTTGRWSGEIFNPQNLPRIDPTKPKLSDALRNSMRAPKGYKVVTSDLSGIELRINHFLWKVQSSMNLYQADPAKADLYREFAANLYTVPNKADVTKQQRQIGKIAHLGLGFGAGGATFQRIAKMMGGVDMPLTEATSVVDAWREEYKEIAAGWRTCHDALTDIANGRESEIDPWGLCHTGKDHIQLPSGRKIWYPGLHRETVEGKKEWWYGEGRNRTRIYAGKVDENIVQALAADCLRTVVRRMKKLHDLRPALLVHDEYVLVVKESRAEEVRDKLDEAMREPPPWWPQLVTWSESGIGDTYGEAH